jgi:hypothetical protein
MLDILSMEITRLIRAASFIGLIPCMEMHAL